MTEKDDLQRREPDPPSRPEELSTWFTDSLRPSSFPPAARAETTMAPTAASAARAAPVESPSDPTPIHDPADASAPASEANGVPQSWTEFADVHGPGAARAGEANAGHSLVPLVFPGEANGNDESAIDEPLLAPPLIPWLPGQRRKLVATLMGAAAVLVGVAFVVLGRSCSHRAASPEASVVAALVQETPRMRAADLPPAPAPPDPADSAQATPPEPDSKGSPGLGPPSPASTEATRWAPSGSSFARFPDLPPDVLLKLWQAEEQKRKEQAP